MDSKAPNCFSVLHEPNSVDTFEIILSEQMTFHDILFAASQAYLKLKPEGSLVVKNVKFSRRKSTGCAKHAFDMIRNELFNPHPDAVTVTRALKIAGFLEIHSKPVEGTLVGIKTSKVRAHAVPKVTIAIPAYRSKFFAEALKSALDQDYLNIEILVADEGVDPEIEKIVIEHRNTGTSFPIIYFKHTEQRGETENINFCKSKATGKYFKLLHDDDVLYPHCVSTLVRFFEAFEDSVGVVTAKRDLIDGSGRALLGGYQYRPLFRNVSYVHGVDMIELCLVNHANFVGEPSSYLLKLSNLDNNLPVLTCGGSRCSFDLVIFVKQLLNSNLVYIPFACSAYRSHQDQSIRSLATQAHCITQWGQLVRICRNQYGLLTDDDYYYTALSNIGIIASSLCGQSEPASRGVFLDFIRWLNEELQKFSGTQGVAWKYPERFLTIL